jgi:transposase
MDRITVALRIPGLMVLTTRETDVAVEVAVQYRTAAVACPRCGEHTGRVHQWHRQWKRDAPLWGKPVWVLLWKRRFRCRRCRRVFTEPDPACGARRRTTRRLRAQLARGADEASGRAVARWHGVSEGLVQRSWAETYGEVRAPARPHVLLGLDGFAARRHTLWTGLWDLETRRPVAVAQGARVLDIQRLLERHADRERVRAVAIDLSEAERQAIQLVLPGAAIVADKFHVVALGQRALREVRGGRRVRGNGAWLLDRGVERLTAAQQARLAAVLAADPAVAEAWALKEGLRALYRCATGQEAARALADWLAAAERSGLAPFRRLAATLRSWRAEVLNSWRYPITNAVVEGKHTRVKALKRRAYGYRNDRHFQLRILNCFHTD